MNFNRIRRLVSGKKARFVTEDGTELDLCYITDRIIICGLPASGVESLYRNDRAEVRRFLTGRYGTKFRIFNFCPRMENGYDAEYFNNQVSRFPFPDHHPPPLSMIPLVTRTIHDWLEADEENVIVIHCKAGKGRSGTMCCCYLLSLPTLPLPPQLPQNNSKGQTLPAGVLSNKRQSKPSSPAYSDSEDDILQPPRGQSGGAAMDLAGIRGTERHKSGRERITRLVENLASSGDEDNDAANNEGSDDEEGTDQAADREMRGMADKLQSIFDLHTAQRMKPQNKPLLASRDGSEVASADTPSNPVAKVKKPVRGVSIPSQRRFVGYWSRVLTKDDPRPLDFLAPPNLSRVDRVRRQVYITEVRIYMPSKMPGFPTMLGKKRISVHLSRYKTSFVDDLEKKEQALRETRRLEKKLRKPGYANAEESQKLAELNVGRNRWMDEEWDDKVKMFEGEGSLVESGSPHTVDDIADSEAAEGQSLRRLFPKVGSSTPSGQVLVDADREVQLKVLIGDSGKKHSMLPDYGSLGYAWIIPSFETSTAPTLEQPDGTDFTVTLDNTDIDFYKSQSGIQKVEIDMSWANN